MVEAAVALAEVAKYLSPGNQNVVDGDLIASIRDLAQIAVGREDLASSSVLPQLAHQPASSRYPYIQPIKGRGTVEHLLVTVLYGGRRFVRCSCGVAREFFTDFDAPTTCPVAIAEDLASAAAARYHDAKLDVLKTVVAGRRQQAELNRLLARG